MTVSPPKQACPPPPSPSPPSSSSIGDLNALDSPSLPQVAVSNTASQISRGHCSPSTPIFLRRAKAHGPPKDLPLRLPRGQVLERTEYCLVRPGGNGLQSSRPPSPTEMASDGCQEAVAPPRDIRSIHRGPHPVEGKDRCLPDHPLSPWAGEEPGEGSTRPRRVEDGGLELAEEKSGLKKLVLTPEQKTWLLDWNDSNLENLYLETGARLSQKSTRNGSGGHVLKPVRPLLLPLAEKETLPAQRQSQEKMGAPAERAPGERSMAPPKSPLRLIANAIRRSLEPLLPNSDSGRKAWAKPESKTLPTSPPHAYTRSFSFRKSSSSKDSDQPSPKRDVASKASAFFSLGSPTSRTAQPSAPSPPAPALCTHSLPSRSSKVFPALVPPPCGKMEDVPTLLEKVSLQETVPDASRVPRKRTSLFSSFRLKDKSFESSLQESGPRKDSQDLFSSPKGKVQPMGNAQPPEKQGQPISSTCLGQRVHPLSPEKDARVQVSSVPISGPTHVPIRAQGTGTVSSTSSSTTSSADEEFHPQPSSRSKERKALRRRRKLEKATKQLVKQEELKRLHKAQAIQRQLEEVEERQRAFEIQGVRLEKALRGEADSGTQDEAQLLQEWLKLVLEKNKLMRYESELLIMAHELELEDHQSRLEQKLREKMLQEESQKDENDLNEEQEILTEMMQVIEQRDKLVDSLEEQRIREKAEDQHFESFIFSRGCQLSRT
ncbi:hypothetical protein M91_01350 [Bos mutus]|uniref:BMERB domain-containing protein n=1 Tax=Bos mutus TaxID=72004 RepID=L8J322_9CETA|nr:hypothetical protein M91_01350 [Bos mutus]